MLLPELSDAEIDVEVDAARARVTGATMRLDDTERQMEALRKQLDEDQAAKAAAVRDLEDRKGVQDTRRDNAHIVAKLRKEIAKRWDAIAKTQDPERLSSLHRSAAFLSSFLKLLCPHSCIVACVGGSPNTDGMRECAICHHMEGPTDDPTRIAKLRDMPGKRILKVGPMVYDEIIDTLSDLPDVAAIVERFHAICDACDACCIPK